MRVILIILISILTLNSQVMAYEEANYEIVKENKEYEIRKYSDRLVIETIPYRVMVLENCLIIFQETMKKKKKLR